MNWQDVLDDFINNPIAMTFFVIIVIGVIIGIKKGWFKYKGNGFIIGSDEEERKIIRNQIEYAETACHALTKSLPSDLNLDYYRTKYVIEKVYDELVKIISFNHITLEEEYIALKQDVIYNVVLSRTEKDYFKSEEFRTFLNDWTKNIIKRLYKIIKIHK